MLTEDQWKTLVSALRQRRCTPVLGAGISYGLVPLGAEIAEEWSKTFAYPFQDNSNLGRVAQFLAVKFQRIEPKELLLEKIRKSPLPDFHDSTQPHRGLAELRLPIYVTTNYDSFLSRALKFCERDVEREFHRWNNYLRTFSQPSVFEREPQYVPTTARPLVYHLHGTDESADSFVLIEDDYIEFLANMGKQEYEIPQLVQRALAVNSLLFVGYSLADWNFRVLLTNLNRFHSAGSTRLNVAVMIPPLPTESNADQVQAYLTQYYADMNVKVHWSTARDFLVELHERLAVA